MACILFLYLQLNRNGNSEKVQYSMTKWFVLKQLYAGCGKYIDVDCHVKNFAFILLTLCVLSPLYLIVYNFSVIFSFLLINRVAKMPQSFYQQKI